MNELRPTFQNVVKLQRVITVGFAWAGRSKLYVYMHVCESLFLSLKMPLQECLLHKCILVTDK